DPGAAATQWSDAIALPRDRFALEGTAGPTQAPAAATASAGAEAQSCEPGRGSSLAEVRCRTAPPILSGIGDGKKGRGAGPARPPASPRHPPPGGRRAETARAGSGQITCYNQPVGDISIELRKGTFLKSFDRRRTSRGPPVGGSRDA